MSITVDIHPSSSNLCMFSEPDTSTAYSLSGHVSISLSSTSLLNGLRSQKVLLRSLTLIFEGQAELLTSDTGYSAVRLCRITRELAPTQAMLLSFDEHEDTSSSGVWNFVFDLVVPGWLPSTSIYGPINSALAQTGTSYALYAEARFTPVEDGLHSRGWSLSSLCPSFTPRIRSVTAPRKEIKIVRYTTPVIIDSVSPSVASAIMHYSIKPRCDSQPERQGGFRIPADIISRIECRASVPECIDMARGNFVFTLRLRTTGLSPEQQQRLRLTHFQLLLSQHETYSRKPFHSYLSAFPLPSSQPEDEPLLNAHALKGVFDLGLTHFSVSDGLASHIQGSFSLLAEKQMQRHKLREGGIALQPDSDLASEQVWTRMDICVPFERVSAGQDVEWELQQTRAKALRPDEESPFLWVQHDMEVKLTLTYEAEDSGNEPSMEHMSFTMPVRFARVSPVKTQESLALPPYSQLFHPNGERRTDNTAPLPAYTAQEESPSASEGKC